MKRKGKKETKPKSHDKTVMSCLFKARVKLAHTQSQTPFITHRKLDIKKKVKESCHSRPN